MSNNSARAPTDPDLQARLLRRFARVAIGFWRGETRALAWTFTIGLLVCLILNVGSQIAVNRWNKIFFDALQTKDHARILFSIWLVIALAAMVAAVNVLLLQVRMRFQLRWRAWLTKRLIRRWMDRRRFYQLSILDLVDNPEARMAEDGRLAIELFVDFFGGVVNAILTAGSFIGVLWFLGGSLDLFGYQIPGYMVLAVVLYSGLTSFGMYLLGQPLVACVEQKSAAEADFRYALTRTRENAETIALIGGDDDEREKLGTSFGKLAQEWIGIIGRQARMVFLSSSNNVLAPAIPLLLGAPKYLSGDLSLGDLMQAAAAFAQVQTALNWLSDNSLRLADWFASARRVAALDAAFSKLDRLVRGPDGHAIDLEFSDDGALHLSALSIAQHDGTLMLADAEAHIRAGERVLVKGESGSGKSTLIRAMAGLWPWGSGKILRPRDARMAFMPQKPYLPLGTLRGVLDYPQDRAPLDPLRTEEVLRSCGLEHLIPRLDDDENWSNILSGGEQQRLAFARVLLKQPDMIVMDEPTSALDELSQTRMMELLNEECRGAMIIHVAHRPGLDRFHNRQIHLHRDLGGPATVQSKPSRIWASARVLLPAFRRYRPK